MTDLEMTKLCAEAMGIRIEHEQHDRAYFIYHPMDNDVPLFAIYSPLHDDAQAMELVKKFNLEIIPPPLRAIHKWRAVTGDAKAISGSADNLNRAIVECVAEMQARK